MKYIGYKSDKKNSKLNDYPNSKYLIGLTQFSEKQINQITEKFYAEPSTFYPTDIWYRILMQELMVLSRLNKKSWNKLEGKMYVHKLDGIGATIFLPKKSGKTKILTIIKFAFIAEKMNYSEFAKKYHNFDSAYSNDNTDTLNNINVIDNPQGDNTSISYKAVKIQPFSIYNITVVQGKQNNKTIYNFKYENKLVSSNPITIIKSMNRSQPYGKYKLIAYCCIDGFMYGLSSDGKLYNSNRRWKDCYTESLFTPAYCSNLIEEHIKNLQSEKIYEKIMTYFYNSLSSLIYN